MRKKKRKQGFNYSVSLQSESDPDEAFAAIHRPEVHDGSLKGAALGQGNRS